MTDLDGARATLLTGCIASATRDGEVIEASALPSEVLDTVVARLRQLDPQADVALDLTCPQCQHGWREPFDIVTFFWSEVAVAARRLLVEVHDLASAYGWSESEILHLSPARRDAYLEMLR